MVAPGSQRMVAAITLDITIPDAPGCVLAVMLLAVMLCLICVATPCRTCAVNIENGGHRETERHSETTDTEPQLQQGDEPRQEQEQEQQVEEQNSGSNTRRRATPACEAGKITACVRADHPVRKGCNKHIVYVTCLKCRVHCTWKRDDSPSFRDFLELRPLLDPLWERPRVLNAQRATWLGRYGYLDTDDAASAYGRSALLQCHADCWPHRCGGDDEMMNGPRAPTPLPSRMHKPPARPLGTAAPLLLRE